MNRQEGFWSLLDSWLKPYRGILQEKFRLQSIFLLIVSIVFFFTSLSSSAEQKLPALFLYADNYTDLKFYKKILENPCVAGIQVRYTWKELEPNKGIYDFSRIQRDLNFLTPLHKKLFIQLQDRSFQPNAFFVPDYIRKDKAYRGGVAMQYDFSGEGRPLTAGWVAKVWDPAVRERFQLLMEKLAQQFDGKIYGINLPETAIDLDPRQASSLAIPTIIILTLKLKI